MRRYESVFVINPDLMDAEIEATVDKFTGIISSQDGTLFNREDWGRRKLAYRIQKFTRGYYVLTDFAGEPAVVSELERNYKLDDRIIRFLTIKTSDRVDVEAVKAELAAKPAAPPEAEKPAVESETPVPVEASESSGESPETEV
ncbi:MAG: 30S ribosomal protein S6 [Desulfobacca sp.]|nr:30S ribosomal protein S6 [Desulfobacca sp.]